MKENIETKDVQKTEYLDKNGLDMLWAKVKENTHNQVEVERNRAVAKEDNITNSLSEFASKTTTDDQYFRAGVISYDTIGTFSKEYGLRTAFLSDYSGDPRLTIRNPKRMDNRTILTASYLFITGYYGGQITISADGVQNQQFILNKKGVWLYGGDGNHVLTSNASTIDITQYVLKSVYDEKIAALEARIAALEAKHTETA